MGAGGGGCLTSCCLESVVMVLELCVYQFGAFLFFVHGKELAKHEGFLKFLNRVQSCSQAGWGSVPKEAGCVAFRLST